MMEFLIHFILNKLQILSFLRDMIRKLFLDIYNHNIGIYE